LSILASSARQEKALTKNTYPDK